MSWEILLERYIPLERIDGMLKKKFKIVIITAAVLWMVVFIQILVTRIYVAQNDFTQAFARNQLTVINPNIDTRNVKEGNTCTEGKLLGRMEKEEMAKLANDLFQSMGGGNVLTSSMSPENNYYVAYGYTSGIAESKNINGRKVNLNVAIYYDENENCTNVIMGTPLINSDF